MKPAAEGAAGSRLVTVVIPTYNRADYIAETIDSVLAQTYPNVEIIVVDDGSTDDTAAVVAAYGSKLRYVAQQNAERGAARNHGLKLATGTYIAFLDSDDLWLPTKLAEAVAILEARRDVGMLCTDAIQIDGWGREVRVLKARGASGRVTEQLLDNNFVIMPTHLARTECVRRIGGFREERALSGSEDWEMWVRLSLVADILYIPGATAKYRVHDANTMSSAEGMQRSLAFASAAVQANPALAHRKVQLRRMNSNFALLNAINHCTGRDRSKALRYLFEAWKLRPAVLSDPRFAYTLLRCLRF